MKLFFDTSVLIDYFSRREPYVKDWLTLLVIHGFGDAELWVSVKSFIDVFCLAQKEVGSIRLPQIFAESLKLSRVCSIGSIYIEEATKTAWNDFEDCLIDVAVRKVKADFIITRDRSGFSKSCVPALSYEQFISWLERAKYTSYEALSL